jgi:hypothetical protein
MIYRIPDPDGGHAFVVRENKYKWTPMRTYRDPGNGKKIMVRLLPGAMTKEAAENALQGYAMKRGWSCA